jgi:site-specific DNA recombinase
MAVSMMVVVSTCRALHSGATIPLVSRWIACTALSVTRRRRGWGICDEYTDHAISGATLLRAGFQALMRDALNRRFDIVLAESLDRVSRDQEDTAGLFKRLTFAAVNIVTLAEGDITHLHIGFKGTMNALFLKDLAEKTHRGLRGRIEAGKSGGGICYGYSHARNRNSKQRALRRLSGVESAPLR